MGTYKVTVVYQGGRQAETTVKARDRAEARAKVEQASGLEVIAAREA